MVGESSNLDARNSGSPVDTNIRPPRNNRGRARWGEPVSRGARRLADVNSHGELPKTNSRGQNQRC